MTVGAESFKKVPVVIFDMGSSIIGKFLKICGESGLRQHVIGRNVAHAEHWLSPHKDQIHMFYILPQEKNIDAIVDAVNFVRNHPRDNVKFSPITVVMPLVTEKEFIKIIDMGIDAVTIFKQEEFRKEFEARFINLIDRDTVFYETKNYFGPEKMQTINDMRVRHKMPDESLKPGKQYIKYNVRRSSEDGCFANTIFEVNEDMSDAPRPAYRSL